MQTVPLFFMRNNSRDNKNETHETHLKKNKQIHKIHINLYFSYKFFPYIGSC